jgi:BlaI family penicillinase repressor
MDSFKLYDAEYRFVQIVWEREPVNSTELVRVCQERLGWKKSTTYTVLRKLCERGILKNENATVSSAVSREQVQAYESGEVVDRAFNGSLPAFLAAFLHGRKLTAAEADELRRMIGEASEK